MHPITQLGIRMLLACRAAQVGALVKLFDPTDSPRPIRSRKARAARSRAQLRRANRGR